DYEAWRLEIPRPRRTSSSGIAAPSGGSARIGLLMKDLPQRVKVDGDEAGDGGWDDSRIDTSGSGEIDDHQPAFPDCTSQLVQVQGQVVKRRHDQQRGDDQHGGEDLRPVRGW